MTLLKISTNLCDYDQVALVHSLTVYDHRPPKRHTIYRNIHRLGINEIVKIRNGNLKFKNLKFKPLRTQNYGLNELNSFF